MVRTNGRATIATAPKRRPPTCAELHRARERGGAAAVKKLLTVGSVQ